MIWCRVSAETLHGVTFKKADENWKCVYLCLCVHMCGRGTEVIPEQRGSIQVTNITRGRSESEQKMLLKSLKILSFLPIVIQCGFKCFYICAQPWLKTFLSFVRLVALVYFQELCEKHTKHKTILSTIVHQMCTAIYFFPPKWAA